MKVPGVVSAGQIAQTPQLHWARLLDFHSKQCVFFAGDRPNLHLQTRHCTSGLRRSEPNAATKAVSSLHSVAKRGRLDPDSESKNLVESLMARHLSDLQPRQLSLVAWSLGKLRFSHELITEPFRGELFSKASSIDAQGISMICWAFAAARAKDDVLVPSLYTHVGSRSKELSVQGISNCLWSCATLALPAAPLITSLSTPELLERWAAVSVPGQACANTLWALASVRPEEDVRGSLPLAEWSSAAAVRCVGNLHIREAASCAWAVATLSYESPNMTSLLVAVAERAAETGNPRLLATATWALAKSPTLACHSGSGVVHGLWGRLADRVPGAANACSGQELANISWAFSQAPYDLAASSLDTLATAAALRVGEMTVLEMSATARALASLRCRNDQWMSRLERGLMENCGDAPLRPLANMSWAWATMEGHKNAIVDFILPASRRTVCAISEEPARILGMRPQMIRREITDPLLQLIWSMSVCTVRDAPLVGHASMVLSRIGREEDVNGQISAFGSWSDTVRTSATSGLAVPRVLHFEERIGIVFKPPGWEVDGEISVVARSAAPLRAGGKKIVACGQSSDRSAPRQISRPARRPIFWPGPFCDGGRSVLAI